MLLLVRAVDALVQNVVFHRSGSAHVKAELERKGSRDWVGDDLTERLIREKEKATALKRRRLTTRIDALVFWACSARWVCHFAADRMG